MSDKFRVGELVIVEWDPYYVDGNIVLILGRQIAVDRETHNVVFTEDWQYNGNAQQTVDAQGRLIPTRLAAAVVETPTMVWAKLVERWGQELRTGFSGRPYRLRFSHHAKMGYLMEDHLIGVRESNAHLLPPRERKAWLEERGESTVDKWPAPQAFDEKVEQLRREMAQKVRHVPLEEHLAERERTKKR